jgi:hypothetical protein
MFLTRLVGGGRKYSQIISGIKLRKYSIADVILRRIAILRKPRQGPSYGIIEDVIVNASILPQQRGFAIDVHP